MQSFNSVFIQAHTKEIKKVWAILEYFRCMIGNTAEAWSLVKVKVRRWHAASVVQLSVCAE
jgi:hypothetical protein